jgi:hypothetical protein
MLGKNAKFKELIMRSDRLLEKISWEQQQQQPQHATTACSKSNNSSGSSAPTRR